MPMDRSVVQAYMDEHMHEVAESLGLINWRVVLGVGSLDAGDAAQCDFRANHNTARITLDPASIEDEADIDRLLYHELGHLVGAPYQVVFNAIEELLSEDGRKVLDAMSTWAHEQLVISLERIRAARPAAKPEQTTSCDCAIRAEHDRQKRREQLDEPTPKACDHLRVESAGPVVICRDCGARLT